MNTRNVFALIVTLCLGACAFAGDVGKSTPKGFMDDFEAAKAEAAKSGKLVLAVFSGSDWCFWCKKLEKDYLSKSKFVDEAKKDFVLVFIDNPQDKSVLSETAKKNNEKLVGKYKIEGFPTVKILDAEGGEIADSRPEGDVSPKGYAEQLRRMVKVGPLVKKHLAPFEEERKKLLSEAFAEMAKRMQASGKEQKGDAAEKAQFEESQKAVRKLIGKLEALREETTAAQMPAEIGEDKEAFVKNLDMMIVGMEQSQKMTWEEAKKMRESARKSSEKRAKEKEGKTTAWLRDWSENVRTNKTLETCAGFRERKLRPFLLKEMDPDGKATSDERRLLNDAIDTVWGNYGFKSFGKRKELVMLLDRISRKPFADMVRAFAEKKDARKLTVAWIESGKFVDEDMRAVFWTLRNDQSVEDAEFSKLLEKSSADPWIKATWRIGPARKAAWKSRGGGWAADVTSEGWDGYRKSGDACRASFGEAMKLRPYPEPVYCFMTLGPYEDRVFETATAALLDFPGLYRTYLFYNCFPRWGGSHEKMKTFAERCYAAKRQDSMVPLFYAETILRMLSDGAAEGGLEAYFKDHPDELDKIIEVSVPLIKGKDAMVSERQCAGAYATLAYSLKGDWAKAGETFRSFGHGTFPNRVWEYIDNFSNWWMIWDGISGPNRKAFQAAQGQYAAGDYRGFIKKLEDLRKTCKLSAQERTYAIQMDVAARMKSTFLEGESIVASFPKDKTMWLTYGGNWRLNGESAFAATKSYRGGDSLGWDVPVPGEFRVDCEIAPHDSAKAWSFVFYQMPDDPKIVRSGRYPYLKLSVTENQCRAAFGPWREIKDFKGGELADFTLSGERTKLSIVYEDGTAKIYVNGSEKPLIETDAYGRTLEGVKSGRLRFNGTSVRLLSLRVSCPNRRNCGQ